MKVRYFHRWAAGGEEEGDGREGVLDGKEQSLTEG